MNALRIGVLATVLATATAPADVYEEGLAAKKAGQFEIAAQLLDRATRAHPENAEAWFHYGTVLGWQKRHEQALAALREGLKRAPRDFDLRLAEARVMAWMADYAGAETRLNALDREFPQNVEVLVMKGRVAQWRKNEGDAKRIYEDILSKDPNQVDALTGLGDIHAERGETPQAREYYQRAVAIDNAPDVRQRLENLKDAPRGRLYLGVTGSTFENGDREDWWSVYGTVSGRIKSVEWWLKAEEGERFGEQDFTLEAGISAPLHKHIRATLFGGFTPDANYSANAYGEAAIRWRLFERAGPLRAGWLLTEARVADYEVSRVVSTRLGWEQELGKGWTVNARWLHLEYETGDATDGWIAFLSWEPREGWFLRAGAARSVESLTNQTLIPGQTSESWTVFGSVVFPITKRLQMRVDFEREEVKNSVTRYGGAVGAIWQF